MPHKWLVCRIGMFTPEEGPMTRLHSLSRFLSRQRARPLPAPGRALLLGATVARSSGEAVCNGPMVHDHSHALAGRADARRLGGAFALIVSLMLAEVVAGIVASSLALLSDAGHMLT